MIIMVHVPRVNNNYVHIYIPYIAHDTQHSIYVHVWLCYRYSREKSRSIEFINTTAQASTHKYTIVVLVHVHEC